MPFSSFQLLIFISVFLLTSSAFTDGIKKISFSFPIKSIDGLSSWAGLKPNNHFKCVPGPRTRRSILLSFIRARTEFILCCMSICLFVVHSYEASKEHLAQNQSHQALPTIAFSILLTTHLPQRG